MKRVAIILAITILTSLACVEPKTDFSSEASSGKIKILATTGMIADMARNVGGGKVEVLPLMGPGVDPHLYKASAHDVHKLSKADLIIYNGLHLEGKMVNILEKIARSGKSIIAIGDLVDSGKIIQLDEKENHPDPHIWFDVLLWASAAEGVAEKLAQLDQPDADYYRSNAARYKKELEELDNYCRSRLEIIPPQQRIMITAHDAFSYFGAAFGVEVVGLQGISSASEFGLNDITRLVQKIIDKKVKAIFVESSVPRRSMEAVVEGSRARGHAVRIGGELFSDALGESGESEGTYIGMIKHNINTIVEALR